MPNISIWPCSQPQSDSPLMQVSATWLLVWADFYSHCLSFAFIFCISWPKSLSFYIKLWMSQDDDDLNILIMLAVLKSERGKDCIHLRAPLLKCYPYLNYRKSDSQRFLHSFSSQCLNTVTHLPIHMILTCLCPCDDTFVGKLSGTAKMS